MLQQAQIEEIQAVVADASSINGNIQYVLQVFGKYFSFLILFVTMVPCNIHRWKSFLKFMKI